MKSKKVRVELNQLDRLKLETLANEHRLLYNHLLEYVRDAKTCNFKLLNAEYVKFRDENNLTINSKSAQNTCRMLIANMLSFFALRKKDNTAKFPHKFKGWRHFCTFIYDWNAGSGGFKIREGKLILQRGLLEIDIPEYASDMTEGNVKTITFSRDDKMNYFISFVYSENDESNYEKNNLFMSIDIGVSNIVTAASNKIESIQIKNTTFKKLEQTTEDLHSKRDKRNKHSRRWNRRNELYQKKRKKLTCKKKDFQHKLSKKLVDICKDQHISKIIIGDLQVKKCKKDFKCKLNKSTQNTGLSRFMTFLEYKAKSAGLDYIKVNEAYTSQKNCLTGKREFKSDLSIRKVELCPGLVVDRDLNSAINIAKKHLGDWSPQQSNFGLTKMILNARSSLIDLKDGGLNESYNF